MKSFNKFVQEKVGNTVKPTGLESWDEWADKYKDSGVVAQYKKLYKEYLDDLEGFLEFKLGTKYKYVEGLFPGNPKTWYEYIACNLGKMAEEHWDKEYTKVKEVGLSFHNVQPSVAPPLPNLSGDEYSIPFPNQYQTGLSKPKIINKKPIRMIN